jgi:3-hydroxyacyl-[acyl-carrier-protein] dehydratase
VITDFGAVLPHREPMLLLDEAQVLEGGAAVTARRTVTADDPWCGPDGVPAHLVLESWLQACAVLAHAGEVLVGGLRGVTATRAIRVGETIEHQVRVLYRGGDGALFTGSASVGAETVLTVEQASIASVRGTD